MRELKATIIALLQTLLIAAALLSFGAQASLAQRTPDMETTEFAALVRNSKRPHLTVVVSIDQFRADYLRRLTDLFLPPRGRNGEVGGFRYLMTQGSYFIDARYNHFPTYTAPGHAVILSGAPPYKTGIVSNDWFDRTTRTPVYCVDDARWKVVGAAPGSTAKPMGPANMRSTTVGDELKLATGGASKVVTLSLKDRAAILLGGHSQDVSLWFDDAGGRWISSTAYCKDGNLPAWVEEVNRQAIPEQSFGTTWTAGVPPAALTRTIEPNLPPQNVPYGMGRSFPHPIGEEKIRQNYRAFTLTPAANAYVFNTAKRAIISERLGGRGDTPDLLALNLATNDYVGHAFGPYSPEALDVTVQTDRQIADFLNFLRTVVPGGLSSVLFVVTADHGVQPIVENLLERNIQAGRVLEADINAAVMKGLNAAFGEAEWVGRGADGKPVGGYAEPQVYLNDAAIEKAIAAGKATTRARIESTAARAIAALPGIYACYTRTQIVEGELPATEITRRVINGFHPKVSGDLIVVPDPMYFTDSGGGGPYITTHGTPYAYDTHVPILICGPGIRPGVRPEPVSPTDIAPTICALLGIEFPSGCDGTILRSALR